MKLLKCLPLIASVTAVILVAGISNSSTAVQGTGTIKGHVRLSGKSPGNTVIRMGVDPMCGTINAGKRQPVVLDERGCVYAPRVLGMRVGQTLQVRNDDPLQHNVHSVSDHGNDINVGQATSGVVSEFRPRSEEVMLRFGCEIHRWMFAYVGVVSHPYFAVSADGGTFEIDNVPPGTQTVQVWHEVYGMLTKTVRVQGGAIANIEFSYTGAEKPPTN
jgi:plastocyanin